MTARLAQLLTLPSLPAARLVAGAADAQIVDVRGDVGTVDEVSWRIARSAPGDGAPGRGKDTALMLVLLTPVARFDYRFDVLLRRCAAAGVTALAVAEGQARLGPGTDALARRLNVALVVAEDAWEFSVRLTDVLGAGDVPAARAALDVAAVGLEAGLGLEETFDELDRTVGYPLVFLDSAARPLRGSVSLDEDRRRDLTGLAGRRPQACLPVTGGELVAVPVSTGIGPRTWLGVVLPAQVPSERAVVTAALRVASVVVGHRLTLTRLVEERDARYRTSMLDELRAAGPSPSPSLVQRTIVAGWRLDEWHIGVRLVAREAADFVALRGDVGSAFRTEGLEAEVVEQLDGWVLWISSPAEPGPALIRKIAAQIRRAQVALRPTIETNVGVGSVQSGAAGLIRTLGEAGDAARVAAGRPEAGHFVHVDRLGLAQLLLAWTQTDTFQPAARQLLGPLASGSGDLLKTLAAYLDAESSLAETSAILGVHRNTVADRIARIERILGVDLTDPETRLALHLATRTFRIEPGRPSR